MIVQKEARGDVEGHKHIDGVVLVGSQNEEDAEHVEQPGERVQEVQIPRSIWKDKE